MSDPAALQEAIQRARQLAAKMAQNVPVKRSADDTPIDPSTVKVTLAYEHPPHLARPNHSINRDIHSRDNHSRDSLSRDSHTRDNHSRDAHSNDRARERDRDTRDSRDIRDTRDRDTEQEILIPHSVIGLVIGKGGENIKRIQNETGATVRVDPNTIDDQGNKMCTIKGSADSVCKAAEQVKEVIENAQTNKRPRMMTESGEVYRMKILATRTGAIIGKGGETIKSIKQQSGCDIELDKNAKDCGDDESVFVIRGTQEKISRARSLIEAKLSSTRDARGSGGGGGGNHKSAATGANAIPVAASYDLPTPAASADATAAWTAYYAQYMAQYQQAGAMGYPSQPGQPQSTSAAQPQVHVPTQAQNPAQAASEQQQQPQAGQADYSAQWIQYYRSLGMHDYAEQIEKMVKARSN